MTSQLAIPEAEPEQAEAPAPKRSALEITHDLRKRLRSRYADTGRYALLEEVGNAIGSGHRRNADALVVCLWPSDGSEWQGFEIKATRSDWLRELKDGDKAEVFARHCDRWWIVAPDKAAVRIDELRNGWGLLVPDNAGGLRIAAGATKRPDPELPKRPLLAAVIRRVLEQARVAPGEAERRHAEDDLRRAQQATKRVETERDRFKEAHEKLLQQLREFEQISGIAVYGYHGGKEIGEDVGRARALQIPLHDLFRYRRLAADAAAVAESAKLALEAAEHFARRRPDVDTTTPEHVDG